MSPISHFPLTPGQARLSLGAAVAAVLFADPPSYTASFQRTARLPLPWEAGAYDTPACAVEWWPREHPDSRRHVDHSPVTIENAIFYTPHSDHIDNTGRKLEFVIGSVKICEYNVSSNQSSADHYFIELASVLSKQQILDCDGYIKRVVEAYDWSKRGYTLCVFAYFASVNEKLRTPPAYQTLGTPMPALTQRVRALGAPLEAAHAPYQIPYGAFDFHHGLTPTERFDIINRCQRPSADNWEAMWEDRARWHPNTEKEKRWAAKKVEDFHRGEALACPGQRKTPPNE